MRSSSWLVRHGWRLGLLAAGVLLLVAAVRNAAFGSAGWSLFAVGLAAGVGIGCVALGWPRKPEPLLGVEGSAFLLGCLALMAVIVFLGRYGAAAGAFLSMTGVYAMVAAHRSGSPRER